MPTRFLAVLLLTVTILTCALRTNPFDPQSPNPRPPELSLDVAYDTIKVDEVRDDTIFAKAPFHLLITARSHFDDSKNLPVSFTHFYNYGSNSEGQWNNFTSDTIQLLKGGLHRLVFETEAKNGVAKTSELICIIDEEIRPSIKLWSASRDSFPFTPNQDARTQTALTELYTEINDPDSLVDSLVLRPCWYNPNNPNDFSRIKRIEMVESEDGKLTYEFPFSPSFDIEERSPFCVSETFACYTQLFLYHKMGLDSVGKNFYFYDTLIYRGLPPHINEINVDPDDNIPARIDLLFSTDVTEQTTRIVSFHWDFGDSSTAITTTNSVVHRYAEKGDYDLILSVEDDSGNIVMDTLSLEIQEKGSAPPDFATFEVINDSGKAPLDVKVTAVPVTGGTVDSIISLTLDFGDGSEPITPPIPKTDEWPHTYTEPGEYTLRVTAVDNNGTIVTKPYPRPIIVTEE